MSGATDSLLLRAFRRSDDLAFLADLGSADWELLIRQARYANALARLATLLHDQGVLERVAGKAADHLECARLAAEAHRRACHWEVRQIHRALAGAGVDVCLLKGCAYAWIGHPASRGRLFGDIDILVRSEQLPDAEGALAANHWVPTKLDAYTQNYYRQWMHEIPPLHNTVRHTDLDVHHTVVPPIADTRFDVAVFWQGAQADPALERLYWLSTEDRLLHSAAHLFQEGEFPNGFRDLLDLDALIRDFAVNSPDWESLLARAQSLDLATHLHYALSLSATILETPVPAAVLATAAAGSRQIAPRRALMLALYRRALLPDHVSCKPRFSALARGALYLRSHYIRMPLRFLLPHLYRKAFVDS